MNGGEVRGVRAVAPEEVRGGVRGGGEGVLGEEEGEEDGEERRRAWKVEGGGWVDCDLGYGAGSGFTASMGTIPELWYRDACPATHLR